MLKTKNINGIIHSIIRACCCCLGSGLGIVDIFCCIHIDTPVSIGNIIRRSGLARSSHKNLLPSGTSWNTIGQEVYKYRDKLRKSSGSAPSTLIIAWYRAIQTGSCTSIGMIQPAGFIPDCLYSLICSWASVCRSLAYFFCSSAICPWIDCMALVALSCLIVSGYIAARTKTVNIITVRPKLLKR